MRALKRKKSSDKNINFLTCSGVPALGPGLSSGAKKEPHGETGGSVLPHAQEEIKKDVNINKSQIEKKKPLLFGGHPKSSPPQKKTPRPTPHARRPHFLRWSFVVLTIAVLAFISPAVVSLVRTSIAVSGAKASMQVVQDRVQAHDLSGAEEALDETVLQVRAAKSALHSSGYWRDIPGVGTQIRALENASDSGIQALAAVQSLLGVARDVLGASQTGAQALEGAVVSLDPERSFRDLSPEEKRSMLARLDRALPDLKEAEAKIDIAVEAWNRIPQDRLIAPLRSAFEPIAKGLPRLKQTIDEAEPLLELLVPLAGYPKPVTYLVLLQNSDELRPTGGFLGTIGRLTVDAGEIKEFSFQDVYALDNPASGSWKDEPPEPIKQRLGVPAWYFRDSNWSPDFPTSARRLLDVYVRERAVATGNMPAVPDGVIAINPPLFTHLMRLLGPIEIDGLSFDANNYFDLLEYQVEEGYLEKGIPVDQRKVILTKLGDELFARLVSLPAAAWPDLVDVLTQTLDRRQMMIYTTEPNLLARLDAFGWTGRIRGAEQDYLSVIDANLAALKTDEVMEKNITYRLDAKKSGDVIATVTLHYTNHATRLATGAPDNFKHTRYRSYTRVYVPEGAELISSSGAMKDDRYRTGGQVVAGTVDVMRELGKTVFGAFWSIEPNTSQDLSFTYRLPASVVDTLKTGSYSLYWQKQSGNDTTGLTLDLLFGKNLKTASPAEDASQWGDAFYRVETDSQTDRQFHVTF